MLEKRAFSAVIAQTVFFSLHFIQSIVIVPFFLEGWGSENYGIWIAIMSLYSLIQVIDSGHQNFVGNEFNLYFHTDKPYAQRILGSSIIVTLSVGVVILIICTLFSYLGYIDDLLGVRKDHEQYAQIKLGLLSMLASWIISGNIGGILYRAILPLGVMHITIYISTALKIAQLIILICAAIFAWSFLKLCIIYALASLLYTYLTFFYVKKVMPDFFPWWQGAKWGLGFANFFKSLVITLNSIFEQFNTNGLIILISNYLSASFIPVFTTLRTLANTALQITGLVLQPLHPELIRLHARGEGQKLIQLFVVNWLSTGFLVNLGFVASLIFIEPLYNWWTKGILAFDISLFGLIVFTVLIANYSRGPMIYLSGMNQLKAMSYISITRFVITASISLAFIQSYGLLALGWALLVAELACTVWVILFAQQLLKSIGASLSVNILSISALPVFVAGVFLAVYCNQLLPIWITLISGVIIILFSYVYLAKFISPEVRQRFQNLIITKFQ